MTRQAERATGAHHGTEGHPGASRRLAAGDGAPRLALPGAEVHLGQARVDAQQATQRSQLVDLLAFQALNLVAAGRLDAAEAVEGDGDGARGDLGLAEARRGELAIGVTGNNIYRDNQSNSRNEFTMFFENFEGIVNTTSCPAHILDIPACWSGVQIDDIAINCQGGDEVGYQS